jgi:hypothetical protein
MDTIMISNLNSEHVWTYEIDPILEALFRYIDSLSLPETLYVTGRPPVSKKSLLKCFFDSLQKLVRILQLFRYFQQASGSSSSFYVFPRGEEVPRTGISCFSRTAAQKFRSTVSPNRADQQSGPSKQSLRFTDKVGSVHPLPLVERI